MDEVDLSAYSGAAGDEVVVMAHDDFAVASVHVSISDGNGQAIESGEAVENPANSGRWIYTSTTAVPQGTNVRIAVAASDQPGGVGEATTTKSL